MIFGVKLLFEAFGLQFGAQTILAYKRPTLPHLQQTSSIILQDPLTIAIVFSLYEIRCN